MFTVPVLKLFPGLLVWLEKAENTPKAAMLAVTPTSRTERRIFCLMGTAVTPCGGSECVTAAALQFGSRIRAANLLVRYGGNGHTSYRRVRSCAHTPTP